MKASHDSKSFAVGTKVHWKWLGRPISGTVTEVYFEPISREIKGTTIKRNGSVENPAYLVQSKVGNFALKLHSELMLQKKDTLKPSGPKMFSN